MYTFLPGESALFSECVLLVAENCSAFAGASLYV